MSNSDKVFAGSVPDIYDAYMVPLIFDSYAADLAARVSGSSPEIVSGNGGRERCRPARTCAHAQR